MGRVGEYRRGFLFKDFCSNRRIYNLCEGYWKRRIELCKPPHNNIRGEFLKNRYGNGMKIYDANPIVFFLFGDRAVRIVLEPEERYDSTYQNEVGYNLTAYLDKYWSENKEYSELVISLFMRPRAVEKAQMILKRWLTEEAIDKEEFERFIIEVLLKKKWVRNGRRSAGSTHYVRPIHVASSGGKSNTTKKHKNK